MEFLPKVDEYFSFYSWFLLGLGLVFQLPIVIFVLSRIGLVTPGFLLRNFKYAVLAAFVIGAVITPTPDMVIQTFVALPMVGLYLLGVLVAVPVREEARSAGRGQRFNRKLTRSPHDRSLAAGLARVQLHHVGGLAQRAVDGAAVLELLRAGGRRFLRRGRSVRSASSHRMSIGNLQFFIQMPWKSSSSKTKSIPRSSGSEGPEHEAHRAVLVLDHHLDLQHLARGEGEGHDRGRGACAGGQGQGRYAHEATNGEATHPLPILPSRSSGIRAGRVLKDHAFRGALQASC